MPGPFADNPPVSLQTFPERRERRKKEKTNSRSIETGADRPTLRRIEIGNFPSERGWDFFTKTTVRREMIYY